MYIHSTQYVCIFNFKKQSIPIDTCTTSKYVEELQKQTCKYNNNNKEKQRQRIILTWEEFVQMTSKPANIYVKNVFIGLEM